MTLDDFIEGSEWDDLEDSLGSIWSRLGDVETAREVSKRNPGNVLSEDVEEYARIFELSHRVWLAMRELKKSDVESASRLAVKYFNWSPFDERFIDI